MTIGNESLVLANRSGSYGFGHHEGMMTKSGVEGRGKGHHEGDDDQIQN
ncbi:hypothetical protein [Bacillus sp. OK048]|nr:hypothetical protein [Bacillus sp. OK048]